MSLRAFADIGRAGLDIALHGEAVQLFSKRGTHQ
jgi:hypothetical protein